MGIRYPAKTNIDVKAYWKQHNNTGFTFIHSLTLINLLGSLFHLPTFCTPVLFCVITFVCLKFFGTFSEQVALVIEDVLATTF